MALLQLLAAHIAGVDQLVFHTFDAAGTRAFEEARVILEEKLLETAGIRAIIDRIERMNFRWGVSDGN